MLNFTKGKWLVHEEYPYGIPIYPKQYYIYLDNGKPEDYFIVCANKADARLSAAAPDMYNFIRTLYELLTNPEDDEEGLSFRFIPEAAKQILDRIDGEED